jgi:hypothetical protein
MTLGVQDFQYAFGSIARAIYWAVDGSPKRSQMEVGQEYADGASLVVTLGGEVAILVFVAVACKNKVTDRSFTGDGVDNEHCKSPLLGENNLSG